MASPPLFAVFRRTERFPRPPESAAGAKAAEIDELQLQRVWPLELVSTADQEQFELLYRLLWAEPLVVKALLFELIFPLTMQHTLQQLSASGQELGGDVLFPVRLGFSGTPSELLPRELGRTEFEAGTDGQFIHLLTSPAVVGAQLLQEDWDVEQLLRLVAGRTDANAFIDSGRQRAG